MQICIFSCFYDDTSVNLSFTLATFKSIEGGNIFKKQIFQVTFYVKK